MSDDYEFVELHEKEHPFEYRRPETRERQKAVAARARAGGWVWKTDAGPERIEGYVAEYAALYGPENVMVDDAPVAEDGSPIRAEYGYKAIYVRAPAASKASTSARRAASLPRTSRRAATPTRCSATTAAKM